MYTFFRIILQFYCHLILTFFHHNVTNLFSFIIIFFFFYSDCNTQSHKCDSLSVLNDMCGAEIVHENKGLHRFAGEQEDVVPITRSRWVQWAQTEGTRNRTARQEDGLGRKVSLTFGWYLHSYAKVHHGHTGVPVPAHVHHGVTTVRSGPLQRGVRSCHVVLRLGLHRGVLRVFWESQEVVTARQRAGWWGEALKQRQHQIIHKWKWKFGWGTFFFFLATLAGTFESCHQVSPSESALCWDLLLSAKLGVRRSDKGPLLVFAIWTAILISSIHFSISVKELEKKKEQKSKSLTKN